MAAIRPHPGELRTVTRLRTYPLVLGRALLWLARLGRALPIHHGVRLYRVEYWTTGTDERPVLASGLMAVPTTNHPIGIVSYQHATRADRAGVPSAPTRAEGVLAALAFGGAGFVVCAPDYIGLGRSPGFHPYLHAPSEASAVVDLLQAVRQRLTQHARFVPHDLFLVGFSQGGHASLAALRRLEADPIEGFLPRATASIAGLHALLEISFPVALEGRSPRSAAYIGYIATAYARVAGRPLDSVAVSPWSQRLESLFDGSRTLPEVAAILPASPKELLLPEVASDIVERRATWFAHALSQNSVDGWVPRSSVRFYYGTADVDAPPADAIETADRMRYRGANAEAVSVGAADHNATAFAAVPLVRQWFSEASEGRPAGRK